MRQNQLKIYFFFICILIFSSRSFSQANISGTVLDDEKNTLPGVSILESGTTNGTVTDIDGNFFLQVTSADADIIFSFIGFTSQTLKAGEIKNRTIILETNNRILEDVVVLGYSEKSKNEIASAVTVISNDQLNDVTANNVETSLQGKVPGLQVVNSSGDPGAAPELRIRGVASLSAPQGPLVVVDGIIGGSYDPRDVESVTVLRDAGATGMYGSQANGGVIIVTTKKGSGVPKFEFSASNGISVADQGNLQMMTGRELYETQKELYRIPEYYVIDLVKFTAERPDSLKTKDFDWVHALFQPAFNTNYYLSASGSSGKLDYYIGGNYYAEEGTYLNTDYKRLNVRANTTYHFSDKVKISNNINLSGANGNTYDYNDLYYTYLSMPWDYPYDADGNAVYVDQNTDGWWSRDKINPIHTIENSIHNYKGISVNYDFIFDYAINNWLSFYSGNRLSVGADFGKNYWSPVVAGTYHDKGFLNQTNSLGYGGISTNLFRFNFEKAIHSFSGLIGYEGQADNFESIFGEGKGLPEGFSVLDVASTEFEVGSSNSKSRMNSIISQANYNYEQKYFLTASFRVDGSSSFTPDNRYATFPSVSGAWLVSNNEFFKSEKIDLLKLRLSYGITGMQDIGPYKYLSLFSLSTQYNDAVGAVALQLPNPNLTWEKTHQVDFGIDIDFAKRFSLNADVYQNITKDLLVQVAQPTSTGFESKWENIGEVKNIGAEFALNTTIIEQKQFNWNLFVTFGTNTNTISGLAAPTITTDSWGISQIYQNGGSLYDFYLKKWVGVDSETGMPLWEDIIDADGNAITPTPTSDYADADNQVVGNALPKFEGGFGSEASWKSFGLIVNAAYTYGNDVYNNNRRFMDNDGHEPYYNLIVLAEDESRWTQPGDVATHPSMTNSPLSTETSSRFLEDGSFVKIRSITLSYHAAEKFVHQLKLNAATIALSFDNPFTFTNYWGQDPETTITPAAFVTPGVSDFKYPNSRKYVLSLNVKW